MIKFKLFSTKSETMQKMIDALSSVTLGNCMYKEADNSTILCKVTDDVKEYNLRALVMTKDNVWKVETLNSNFPTNEPTRSYAVTLCELIDAFDGKGYRDGIEFINRLSKKE